MESHISEIQIVPIKPVDGLVGFASFVYDNNFFIGSVGIFTRPSGGFRLTYPMKNHLQIVHPINKVIATEIEQEITKRFEELLNLGS